MAEELKSKSLQLDLLSPKTIFLDYYREAEDEGQGSPSEPLVPTIDGSVKSIIMATSDSAMLEDSFQFFEANDKELLCKSNDPVESISMEDVLEHFKSKISLNHGELILYLGMEDTESESGADLNKADLITCMERIKSLASKIPCQASVLHISLAEPGVDKMNCCAAILLRQGLESTQDYMLEIRVACVGNVDAGKSTTLGVLTKGTMDDGRGRARQDLFKHQHESATGRTSSVGMEMMGFDSLGNVVGPPKAHPYLNSQAFSLDEVLTAIKENKPHESLASSPERERDLTAQKKMSWDAICSQSSKIVTFIDLAGHEKYLKTTVFGMTGHSPDFVMLMIGANAGVIGMTKEHLGLAVALNVPFFCVITKIDMCPANVLEENISKLSKLLKSPGCRKTPVFIKESRDVALVANHFVKDKLCPIFQISNVNGLGLDLLKQFLNLLPAHNGYSSNEAGEYQITETFSVPGVGTVVAGTLLSGQVKTGSTMFYGPDATGTFHPVLIKSIQRKRVNVPIAYAGNCASLALKKVKRSALRKGMVILEKSVLPGPLPSPYLSQVLQENPGISLPNCHFGYVAREFEAEVLVLKHSTTIRTNYQAMLHCGTIKQTVTLVKITSSNNASSSSAAAVAAAAAAKSSNNQALGSAPLLRTGDQSVVRFRFIKNPEYLQLGKRLLFREGQTRGVGRIIRVISM